jgi:hypothetical protein
MEIPTMRPGGGGGEGFGGDVFANAENGQQIQMQHHVHPRQSRDECDEEEQDEDEEQLEMYVNDILGGVADMEEVGSSRGRVGGLG